MTLETIAVKVANVDATVNILQKTTNASNEKLTLDTNSMRTINHQVHFLSCKLFSNLLLLKGDAKSHSVLLDQEKCNFSLY